MAKQRKKIAYCSIDPQFPRDAFVIVLILIFQNKKKSNGIFPLSNVFTSPDDVREQVNEVLKTTEENNVLIPEECILLPVKYTSSFPLQRKYWENPNTHYDTMDRIKMFISLLENPGMYHLLVTPTHLDKPEKPLLHAALPLRNSDDSKVIERFMLTSDLPVDERAKSSAVYKVNKPMIYNWQTKEISPIRVERK